MTTATVRSIAPNAFRVAPSPTLLGGYSPTSCQFHFPRQPVCPYTGADDVRAVELSRDATLWGWTAITAAPPGYAGPVPYGFGVVELVHEQLRIVTRLTQSDPTQLAFGDAMTLVAETIATDDDGTAVAMWAFAATKSSTALRTEAS